MKKSGMELIAIAHYSLLFGASGKRHGVTDNFLAISWWLLAIAVSFREWEFGLCLETLN